MSRKQLQAIASRKFGHKLLRNNHTSNCLKKKENVLVLEITLLGKNQPDQLLIRK